MNFFRALCNGRLAEMIGPDGVAVDKYIRTIGMPARVAAYMKVIKEQDRDVI